MFATQTRVTDNELATQAKELANLLNRLPLPPVATKSRPTGGPTMPGRASGPSPRSSDNAV